LKQQSLHSKRYWVTAILHARAVFQRHEARRDLAQQTFLANFLHGAAAP
jgi:hypothetical protein